MTTVPEFPILYLSEGEPSKWNQDPGRGGESDNSISAYQPYFTTYNRKMAGMSWREIYVLPEATAGKEYMGKKDLAGKEFFADRQRFAELLNVVLYHGENIIQAEDLERMIRIYPSFSGRGEMRRDIFVKDKKRNVYYGLELETESDYSMPERVMVYDACEFERQISKINKSREREEQEGKLNYREKKSRMRETEFLMPVVTIVLYLGTGHWEGRSKLSELYHVSEETEELMRGMLPDYGFPLLEADYIDAEAFETDLKQFFQAMQCRRDKEKLRELLRVEQFRRLKEETAWVIAVHLDRKRLATRIKREELGMCIALDELLADEREEGREEGRGSIIRNMIQQGFDEEFICRITGCTKREFVSAAEK